jgi:hypothetical protein
MSRMFGPDSSLNRDFVPNAWHNPDDFDLLFAEMQPG